MIFKKKIPLELIHPNGHDPPSHRATGRQAGLAALKKKLRPFYIQKAGREVSERKLDMNTGIFF